MKEKEEIRTAYQGLVNALIKSIKSSMETEDLDLCDELLAVAAEVMGSCAESLVSVSVISDEQALALNDRLLDMEVLFNAMREETEKAQEQLPLIDEPSEQLRLMEEDLGLS